MAVSLSLAITQNSQSLENNTSSVTVKVTAKCTYGSWNATGKSTGTITIDGTAYSFSGIKFNTGAKTNWSGVVMTKTVNVTHNDDGTKTVACSASLVTGLDGSGTVRASGSKALTTIARASQPSLVTWPESTAAVGNFGETFSIHMNRKADTFTHTVRYEYGDRSGTIATGVTTGTTWAVPLDFMNDIPSAPSASGLIYVDTYRDSTLVGTKYTGFTVTVPSTVKPTCSLSLEDTSGVDEIYGSPVQGLSKIKITVGFTAAYGSAMASCKITANGVSYTGTSATTGVLQTAGASLVTATVTDKRAQPGSASYIMNVQAYAAPKVTALTVHRCDADGNNTDQGKYIKVLFSAAISSMGSKNTAAYVLRHKKSTASSWTEVTLSALANKYTVVDHSYIFAADESSSYDVEVTATDRHGSATRSTSASTAFSLMDWHPSGTGVRWGGVSELDHTFQNDLELKQTANRYVANSPGVAGTEGFVLMASIEIVAANADTPITFIFTRRQELTDMKVSVRFRNSDLTGSELISIRYEGSNYGAFLVPTGALTWDLYVEKGSNYDTIALQDWYTSMTMASRVRITFPGTLVDTVPTPYHRATPAVLESILDAFMPVGFVLTLYSHADPNDMYPGTTWARISNAFLWATSAGGTIGQTGGESTHTLTVDEMPSHRHALIRPKWYAADGNGTVSTDAGSNIYAYTSGTSPKYRTTTTGADDVQAAGGGKAHNNMPPYIQVSIWRRTA